MIRQFFEQKGDDFLTDMRIKLATVKKKQGVRGEFSSSAIASGNLFKSLRKEIEGDELDMTLRIYGAEYYIYADRGRGAGGMPPVSRILEWIKAKGLSKDEKTDMRFGWALAKSIAGRGTAPPPSFFFSESKEKFFSDIKSTFKDAVFDEVGKKFSILVQNFNNGNS